MGTYKKNDFDVIIKVGKPYETEYDLENICDVYFISRKIIGMKDSEYKNTVEIIDEGGISTLSDELLITFFEQTLIYINIYYNSEMELYERSEKYYEITKQEILSRFKGYRK